MYDKQIEIISKYVRNVNKWLDACPNGAMLQNLVPQLTFSLETKLKSIKLERENNSISAC